MIKKGNMAAGGKKCSNFASVNRFPNNVVARFFPNNNILFSNNHISNIMKVFYVRHYQSSLKKVFLIVTLKMERNTFCIYHNNYR